MVELEAPVALTQPLCPAEPGELEVTSMPCRDAPPKYLGMPCRLWLLLQAEGCRVWASHAETAA